MIEIGVMYGDLSIKRYPIESIGEFATDGVLFITVRDTEVEGKAGNVDMISGFDKYAVCHKVDGGKDWVMLVGWDEDDFVWRQVGCQGCRERVPVDMPLGIMHMVFHGKQVSEGMWIMAMKAFDREMS